MSGRRDRPPALPAPTLLAPRLVVPTVAMLASKVDIGGV